MIKKIILQSVGNTREKKNVTQHKNGERKLIKNKWPHNLNEKENFKK